MRLRYISPSWSASCDLRQLQAERKIRTTASDEDGKGSKNQQPQKRISAPSAEADTLFDARPDVLTA